MISRGCLTHLSLKMDKKEKYTQNIDKEIYTKTIFQGQLQAKFEKTVT